MYNDNGERDLHHQRRQEAVDQAIAIQPFQHRQPLRELHHKEQFISERKQAGSERQQSLRQSQSGEDHTRDRGHGAAAPFIAGPN